MFASAALRSSEATACETHRQKVSSHMSIQLSTADETNLASHLRKRLGGNRELRYGFRVTHQIEAEFDAGTLGFRVIDESTPTLITLICKLYKYHKRRV